MTEAFGITAADEAVILVLAMLSDPTVPQKIKRQFLKRVTRSSIYPQMRAVMQESDLALLDSILAGDDTHKVQHRKVSTHKN